MKRWRHILFWLIAVIIAILAFFLFVLTPLDDQFSLGRSVTQIYYADNISDAHQKMVDVFNQEYAGEIEVIPVNLPFSKFTTNERKEILARSLRSQSEHIDVFAVDLIWSPRFAKWSVPLDDHIGKNVLDNIHEKALKSCYFNEKLVAMPLYLDFGNLYYRRDFIRELKNGEEIEQKILNSITWEELLKLGEKFRNKDIPVYLFAGDKFEGLVCSFHEMLSDSESAEMFDGEQVNLNTPAARRGLQLLVDLIYKYKLTPPIVTEFDEYNSYIYSNIHDALFLRGWTGFHKHYFNVVPDTSKLKNFLLAPLPHFKGNTTSSVYGGWNLMISKNSTKQDACLKFLKFAFRKDIQQILYALGGYIPVNKEVYNDHEYMDKHQGLAYILKLFEWGRHRPYKESYTKISDIMSIYLHKALKNEMGVEEALITASQAINSQRAFIK